MQELSETDADMGIERARDHTSLSVVDLEKTNFESSLLDFDFDLGEDTNEHTLEINCQAVARATANLDDSLHALAAAGLAPLFAPPVPYSLRLTAIDREMSGAGEAAVGAVTLTLRATYAVAPAAPETIL